MKYFLFFITLIAAAASASCLRHSESVTVNNTVSSTSSSAKADGREEIIRQSIPDFEKSGIKVRLGGANKDVLYFDSQSVPNEGLLLLLENSFEKFREAGFTRIILTDKSKEIKEVDFTVVDTSAPTFPAPEKREKLMQEFIPRLAADGIKLRIEGKNKDVLYFDSQKISNYEMLTVLPKSFEMFRTAGFSQIILTDKTKEVREVDLTVFDKPRPTITTRQQPTQTPAITSKSAAPTPEPTADAQGAQKRREVVQNAAPFLINNGIKTRLGGKNMEMLYLESDAFSSLEMMEKLRDSIQAFKDAGFTRVIVTDKSKEVREFNLDTFYL